MQLQLHAVPDLRHWFGEMAPVYPGATERAGRVAYACPTTALQYFCPGMLRMEDLLMAAYEGGPLDLNLLGKALWLGSVECHMGNRELGAKGTTVAAVLHWR